MESTDVINEIRGILPRNSIGKYDLLTIFTHKTVFDKIVKVLSLDFDIDNLKGFLNDTSSFGFIAKENNKIIGFAYCYTLLR
ncbi:TPA: hypothetical protein ACGO8I_002532, partial [Streptococcus suis]